MKYGKFESLSEKEMVKVALKDAYAEGKLKAREGFGEWEYVDGVPTMKFGCLLSVVAVATGQEIITKTNVFNHDKRDMVYTALEIKMPGYLEFDRRVKEGENTLEVALDIVEKTAAIS